MRRLFKDSSGSEASVLVGQQSSSTSTSGCLDDQMGEKVMTTGDALAASEVGARLVNAKYGAGSNAAKRAGSLSAPISPEGPGAIECAEKEVPVSQRKDRKHRRAKSAILGSLGRYRGSHRPKMGDSLDDTDPVVQLKSKEVYLDIKSLEIRENHGFVSKRRGIRNLGNSCFLSAAIQCFVSTPGIVDNLLPNLGTFICEHNTPTGESSDMQKESNGASEGQEENKDGTESSGAENETSSKDENHETQDIGIPSQKQNQREDKPEPGQLAKVFSDVVKQLYIHTDAPQGSDIVPLIQILRRFPAVSDYVDGTQQDGQEVLMALMDLLHEDLKVADKDDSSCCTVDVKIGKGDNMEVEKANKVWRACHLKSPSIISDTFMGQLQSSVICSTCNTCFTTYEPFLELSLSLAPKSSKSLASWFGLGTVTLKDCLFEYTSEDKLEGEELFSCEKCNKKTEAIKKLRLHRLPEALVLHIKRFKYKGTNIEKLENFVKFPLKGLDIRDHTSFECPHPPEDCIYDLYAAANHTGSLTMGHYLANCLVACENASTGRIEETWMQFNDELVKNISAETVVSANAYILFYKRRKFSNPEAAAVAYQNLDILDRRQWIGSQKL
eukprot:jgi/Picsp_1/255/NSC_00254-R1_ubiquitin carboxyl-terminal hydrolase 2-like